MDLDGLFEPTHLIFILIIALIIFGPGKLPELGRGLGKSIREFKEAIRGVNEEPTSASDKKLLKSPQAEGEAGKQADTKLRPETSHD